MDDKRKLKIAFVCEPWDTVDPPPTNYSGPILTYEIATRLAKSCETVVYSRIRPNLPDAKNYESVEYRYQRLFADRRGAYRLTHLPFVQSFLDKFTEAIYPDIKRPSYAARFAFWTYILPIAIDLRSRRCDIVHIHQFSQFVPIIRAVNPRIKIVLHMHTDWLNQLDRGMIEPRIRKSDLVIGCSDFIASNIRKRFPEFAEKCGYLHNGADVNHFSGSAESKSSQTKDLKRVLFVGRVSPEKGVHILLDAFCSVLEKHPKTELLIVGPQRSASRKFIVDFPGDPIVTKLAMFYNGSYLAQLQSKITPDIADRIQFIGPVQFRQLNDFYRSSDVFVMPSVWSEPFGMPVVEAMASNCAVVATRAGGFMEIVEDGKNGLLVERDNTQALAEAIVRLLDDDEYRKKLANAGRQRIVEHFSWEKIVDDLLAKYNNLTNP